MFKRGGTRNKVSPEAVSEEGEALRVDFGAGIRIVDDGAYDSFPIWPENELFMAYGGTLTRSIERKNIVTTSQCRSADRDIGILPRRGEHIILDHSKAGVV